MQLLRRNKRFITGLSSLEWLNTKEESLNNYFQKEEKWKFSNLIAQLTI